MLIIDSLPVSAKKNDRRDRELSRSIWRNKRFISKLPYKTHISLYSSIELSISDGRFFRRHRYASSTMNKSIHTYGGFYFVCLSKRGPRNRPGYRYFLVALTESTQVTPLLQTEIHQAERKALKNPYRPSLFLTEEKSFLE